MPICPFTVCGGALRGEFRVHPVDIVDQHLRSDDAGADASLSQRILRELLLLGALGVQRLLAGDRFGVGAKQFHGFIQQRNIADGKRRPFGANQCFDIAFLKPWCEATKLLRLAEQLVDKPFAGHRQPCEIQRLAQGVIHAQLLHHIRQLRLLRLVIKLVHITVAHGDQHAMHESFACFVVLLSRALGIGDGLFDIRAHDGHCESVDADRRQ